MIDELAGYEVEVIESSGFMYVELHSDYFDMEGLDTTDAMLLKSGNVYRDIFGTIHMMFPIDCLKHIQ